MDMELPKATASYTESTPPAIPLIINDKLLPKLAALETLTSPPSLATLLPLNADPRRVKLCTERLLPVVNAHMTDIAPPNLAEELMLIELPILR
jgi:hypothetical protein